MHRYVRQLCDVLSVISETGAWRYLPLMLKTYVPTARGRAHAAREWQAVAFLQEGTGVEVQLSM